MLVNSFFGYVHLVKSSIRASEARQHDKYCLQKRPIIPNISSWNGKQTNRQTHQTKNLQTSGSQHAAPGFDFDQVNWNQESVPHSNLLCHHWTRTTVIQAY